MRNENAITVGRLRTSGTMGHVSEAGDDHLHRTPSVVVDKALNSGLTVIDDALILAVRVCARPTPPSWRKHFVLENRFDARNKVHDGPLDPEVFDPDIFDVGAPEIVLNRKEASVLGERINALNLVAMLP